MPVTDDIDLYPPDVEHVTPEAHNQRVRAVFGVTLVGVGSGLFLERALHHDLDYFWLALGIGLLVGWAQVPRFPMFVAGSIMTGFGAAAFVDSALPIPFDTTLSALCGAAGFFAVWVRYPNRARWALVPAAGFAFFGVAAFGVNLIGLFPAWLAGLMLPLFLILGGAMLVMRNSLPKRIVRTGLAVAAIGFVGAAATSVPDWSDDEIDFGPRSFETALPPIGDRTVVIDADAGSIEVVHLDGEPAPPEPIPSRMTADGRTVTTLSDRLRPDIRVEAISHGPVSGIAIEEDDNEIRLELIGPRGPFGHLGPVDYRLFVPAGTNVEAEIGSGDITARYAGGEMELDTGSGRLRVQVVDAGDSDGELDIESGSGSIEIEMANPEMTESIALDLATGSGEIVMSGQHRDDDFEREADGMQVKARTGSGDIRVTP